MFTKLFTAAIVGLGIAAVHSGHIHFRYQHGQDQGQDHGQHHVITEEHLAKGLGASPEQIKKIQGIRHDYFRAVFALHQNGGGEDKFNALTKEAATQLEKALTPDQLAKVDAFGGVKVLLDIHAAMYELLGHLDLSEGQRAKVDQLMADAESQMEAIKANKNLTATQAHEKMSQLHEGAMQKIHAILTPEQLQKLQSIMGGKGHGGS